ncbi:hypothetical protein COJ48_12405 [Bacillus cereus]|uniref:Phr family secreted Rap phosphatase inhibitor n=1 Tax=Bacillus paramycoides TaxID=2026194 RepID=A0A1J9UU94_9BACI|nr:MULTISPECIES: hypothetical protein [Bacillus]PFM64161.1 hypothetical protein COJ48_12405 [Bacillus cereus]KMN45686.1 hypothetical protein VK90_06160 [Bacillus sp. LK2]MED0978481.1 hypothetical protein [Bacillus paramycoides]MED0983194.1 hypothetical protein [Bacillus paramycoides]MED1093053.1 hypothetical protein [Bacillus paramycoides]
MKKIKLSIIGLAVMGISTLGLGYTSEIPITQQGYVALNIGDTPAPQRPDFFKSVDVSKDYNSTTTEKSL